MTAILDPLSVYNRIKNVATPEIKIPVITAIINGAVAFSTVWVHKGVIPGNGHLKKVKHENQNVFVVTFVVGEFEVDIYYDVSVKIFFI